MFSLKSEIGIIGAGRVSYSLVNALIKSGFKVSSVISHSTSAKKLALKFKIKNYSSDLNIISPNIKIFFLAVPDRQIPSVAQQISKLRLDFKNSLFIHLSGAEDISVLNTLKKEGAYTGSLHIMQTFPERQVINLKNCYAAVETNSKKVRDSLFALAKKINLHPFRISSEKKVLYHIAGVYSSNFLVANQYYTEKLFNETRSGIYYRKVFTPITEMAMKNIKHSGVLKAVSGPVARGDIKTVKKHLKTIRNDKVLRLNYISQSLGLLELIKKRDKKLSTVYEELRKYLLKLL